jgi:crotonobetainyl-CoA:carnitine CoA-transferase CaiB-like acyl-CoA transferase
MLIMIAAAAALAGCNKESHTIVAGPDLGDNATNTTSKDPVALPPTIASSKVYRCADNKIVYVDWLSDNKTANIRTEKTGTPTQVTASDAGKPMAGPAGYSLDGTVSAKSVKIAIPGHASQNCNA